MLNAKAMVTPLSIGLTRIKDRNARWRNAFNGDLVLRIVAVVCIKFNRCLSIVRYLHIRVPIKRRTSIEMFAVQSPRPIISLVIEFNGFGVARTIHTKYNPVV